jgi:hypothetical protein
LLRLAGRDHQSVGFRSNGAHYQKTARKTPRIAVSNPVFAPGPENFERMGALAEIWHEDLATCLQAALQQQGDQGDQRAQLGLARGGRSMAQTVIAAVLAEERSENA